MSWLSVKFRRNPLQNFILSIMISIHIIFLLILLISPSFISRKKEHKPLIVKTIVPKTTAPIEKKRPVLKPISPAQTAIIPPKSQEISKTQAPPKKETSVPKATVQNKTPSAKKEPAIAEKQLIKPQPKPTPKKNQPVQNRAKISDSLLKELEESIAKMENEKTVSKKAPQSKALAPIPLQIDLLPSEQWAGEDEIADYSNLLVDHLHQSLRLPDYGEVKIQLILRQDGTVVKVIVLKAQSEKNKHYLESNLSKLKFPRFEGTYSNKKESAFILTFCNE